MPTISDLPYASLPLAGNEKTIVNSQGGTRSVTISDLATPLALGADFITTSPSAPTQGLKLFADANAGRRRLGWVGPSNLDVGVQSYLAANKCGYWGATGNITNAFNSANPGVMLWNFNHNVTGTATARNVVNTNLFTSTKRLGIAAGTSVSSVGTRHGILQFSRRFGFEYVVRFGISGLPSSGTGAWMVGLISSAAIQSQIGGGSAFGVCLRGVYGAAPNAWTIQSKTTASGTPTTHATLDAIAFPTNTANVDVYQIRFFCAPAGTSIFWRMERLNTGDVAEGEMTTDLPPEASLLSPIVSGIQNTASAGWAVDIISQYIETDY